MNRTTCKAISLTLFVYGLLGALYIVANAEIHPDTLALPLTHLLPFPREDTFGIISAAVSMVSFFFWNLLRENN